MIVMMIGDVIGESGCSYLGSELSNIKRKNGVDIVIANGENSAEGNGISKVSANSLLDAGVDIITTGNHVFRKQGIEELLDNENIPVVRPANYPKGVAGRGYLVEYYGKNSLAVVNLMGTSFMEDLDNPFYVIDEILEKITAKYIVVDIHAEATGEKKALAYYIDGKVSAVVGTHTHVQTADEQVLPNGTLYITDVGMTGSMQSILGVEPACVIQKLKYKTPVKFVVKQDNIKMDYVIMDLEKKTIIRDSH